MTGFYKVPRDEVFTADGFYPTGDLVRIDEDGYRGSSAAPAT